MERSERIQSHLGAGRLIKGNRGAKNEGEKGFKVTPPSFWFGHSVDDGAILWDSNLGSKQTNKKEAGLGEKLIYSAVARYIYGARETSRER